MIELILLFIMGVMIGMVMGEFIMLCGIYHKWYGDFIPRRENLPFSTKLKEKIKNGEMKL